MLTYQDLCRPTDYKGQPVRYAQKKEDGLRLLVSILPGIHDEKIISAVTREGKTDHAVNLLKVDSIWTKLATLPVYTQLDCEIHVPNVQATNVITHLLSGSNSLKLSPFAMPFFYGQDLRGWELPDVISKMRDLGLDPVPVTLLTGKLEEALWLQRARDMRAEGFVLKQHHYSGWFKLKPVKTADCVVMGYTLSDSTTYFGDLKAVQVGVIDTTSKKLVEVASLGTGFSAEQRRAYGQKPGDLLGKVCEVQYDSLAGQGKLKFPRFVGWRVDKLAEECTSKQLV
jgi:hypothetical protein